MSATKAYRIWYGLLKRCENPNATEYKWYGGRGIALCERWKTLENFVADMGEPPEGGTLDRIDNDKGYEPGNCRWATMKEQMRNQSRNRWIEFRGERKCVADWATQFGLSHHCLLRRVYKYGWSVEKALLTPSERAR